MGGSNSKNLVSELQFRTLGVGNAGKSSLIYRLVHGKPHEDPTATIGFDYNELHEDGIKIHAFDYTGRGHWGFYTKHEYTGADGIILMIDSADPDRIEYILDEILCEIFKDERNTNMTLMIVANKQDLSDAIGPEEIEEKIKESCDLDYVKRKSGITAFVMPMCAIAEDGHSVELAFRLFVKIMKRKQQKGKIANGLIPRAWEKAEKMAEDSDTDDDKDDAKKAKKKEANLAFNIGGKKKSFFKDPVHIFKSILTH